MSASRVIQRFGLKLRPADVTDADELKVGARLIYGTHNTLLSNEALFWAVVTKTGTRSLQTKVLMREGDADAVCRFRFNRVNDLVPWGGDRTARLYFCLSPKAQADVVIDAQRAERAQIAAAADQEIARTVAARTAARAQRRDAALERNSDVMWFENAHIEDTIYRVATIHNSRERRVLVFAAVRKIEETNFAQDGPARAEKFQASVVAAEHDLGYASGLASWGTVHADTLHALLDEVICLVW